LSEILLSKLFLSKSKRSIAQVVNLLLEQYLILLLKRTYVILSDNSFKGERISLISSSLESKLTFKCSLSNSNLRKNHY